MAGERGVIRNLRNWEAGRRTAIILLAKDWAGTMEGRAKINASWQDRTGDARAGLRGEVVVGRNQVTIALAHSMDYGPYLEMANDGKYAVLKPTLDAAIPDIYRTYKRLWE